jgi:hypothetical protein
MTTVSRHSATPLTPYEAWTVQELPLPTSKSFSAAHLTQLAVASKPYSNKGTYLDGKPANKSSGGKQDTNQKN